MCTGSDIHSAGTGVLSPVSIQASSALLNASPVLEQQRQQRIAETFFFSMANSLFCFGWKCSSKNKWKAKQRSGNQTQKLTSDLSKQDGSCRRTLVCRRQQTDRQEDKQTGRHTAAPRADLQLGVFLGREAGRVRGGISSPGI